ncbi:hypothetical protein FGO68_gene11489 [Halteria grandinella]|uniref:Uncharacterized protein n=1 Tax=Halteria grandinella TaxID=5974 RepID=A0A8J8NXY7_HALGN|nr:hypothetical protein FGO68_gene11489 [Halteria grandinella]
METEIQLLSIDYESNLKSAHIHNQRRKKRYLNQYKEGHLSIRSAGQYRFGKIKSKYIIIEVLSYSGQRRKVLQLMSQSSKALKLLAIQNLPIFIANLSSGKILISTSSELLRMLLKKNPDSANDKFKVLLQGFMQSKMLDYLLILGRYAPDSLRNLHKIAFKLHGLNRGETGQEPLISYENEILIKLREVIQKCKSLHTLQYPKYQLEIIKELVIMGNIKHLKFDKDQWRNLESNVVNYMLSASPNKQALDQLYNQNLTASIGESRSLRRDRIRPEVGRGRGQPVYQEEVEERKNKRLHTLEEMVLAFKEQPKETYVEVEKLTITYSSEIDDVGQLLRLIRPTKKLRIIWSAKIWSRYQRRDR